MPANIWKILNKNSPGTSGTFAADDWDMTGRYMNDVDLSATASPSIKTNTSFWDNRLRIWNPAKTKSYRIRGLAIVNDYDLTLPLLSSNDEIVGLITGQTLQNKIINVNNNTLKHGTTNAIGDLLVGTGTKYDRLAMGSTGGYVLAVKNDLTGLEWIAAGGGGTGEANTGSNVGTAGVGIFKQKAGVNLEFKKINVASGGLITITDDTANNEVDLKITGGTDGQFLKTTGTTPTWTTLTTQYGRIMPDGSNYSGARYGAYLGGAADGDGMLSGTDDTGILFAGHTGPATRTKYTSAAVDGDTAGWRTRTLLTRRSQSPRYKVKFAGNPTTERCFVGFINNTVYPGGFDPLINKAGMIVGFDAGDTNFVIKWNNNSASSQVSATSVLKDTALHVAELLIDETTSSVSAWFDGTQIVNANTVQVPTSTDALAIHNWVEAVGNTSTTLEIEYAMLTFP